MSCDAAIVMNLILRKVIGIQLWQHDSNRMCSTALYKLKEMTQCCFPLPCLIRKLVEAKPYKFVIAVNNEAVYWTNRMCVYLVSWMAVVVWLYNTAVIFPTKMIDLGVKQECILSNTPGISMLQSEISLVIFL